MHEGEDQPGEWVIIMDEGVAVQAECAVGSAEIAELKKRTRVTVVEVRESAKDKRIRGRLSEPAGWISLRDMTDNQRSWAEPVYFHRSAASAANVKAVVEAKAVEKRIMRAQAKLMAKKPSKPSATVVISEELAAKAEAVGMLSQLRNLAGRSQLSHLDAACLLAELEKNNGLVNQTQNALLCKHDVD